MAVNLGKLKAGLQPGNRVPIEILNQSVLHLSVSNVRTKWMSIRSYTFSDGRGVALFWKYGYWLHGKSKPESVKIQKYDIF